MQHLTKKHLILQINFFKHSIGITVFNELPNEIIIETNPILSKYLISQPLHHSQILKEVINNGNHIFSFHLLITYELKMLLLGFGKDCKIIAPEILKKQVLNDLKVIDIILTNIPEIIYVLYVFLKIKKHKF